MIKLRKSKFMKAICLLMACSILSLSCTNNDAFLKPNFDDNLSETERSVKFFSNLKLNEDLSFEEKHSDISLRIENEYGTKNPMSLGQSRNFKNEMIDYFVNGNEKAFTNSNFVQVSPLFLETVKEFTIEMTSIHDQAQIKEKSDELKVKLKDLNLSTKEANSIEKMISIYQNLSNELIKKYSSNDIQRDPWIKCKWYQWACVAAYTAAAAALIAGTGGAALLVYVAAGATVAMVAACCFCRCKCSFYDGC